MAAAAVVVREMRQGDLPAVSALAGALVRLHHAWDAKRFFLPDQVEAGYAWWLGRQLEAPGVLLLVAELDGEPAGYLYATLEERDWALLRDACGVLQDLFVAERFRRRGVARRLLDEGLRRLAEQGAPRVVLMSATQNAAAQALFASAGFRPTMVEMTRES